MVHIHIENTYIDDKKISDIMYILKIFALYSIILNHTSFRELVSVYQQNLIQCLSSFGVTLFYIISGYYFSNNKSFGQFFKRKAETLFLPWFALGTLYFILPKLPGLIAGDSTFSWLQYVNFIIGNGGHMYFLTILTLCYLIMYFVPHKNWLLLLLLFITVSLNILFSYGVIEHVYYSDKLPFSYWGNKYLNVFNYLGYFCAGIWLRKNDILKKYIVYMYNMRFGIYICSIILIILSIFSSVSNGMISGIKFGIVIFICMSLFLIAYTYVKTKAYDLTSNVIIKIGKMTMPVYIAHLWVLIILKYILHVTMISEFIKPIITIFVFYIFIQLGYCICKKIKIDGIYQKVLGIRW